MFIFGGSRIYYCGANVGAFAPKKLILRIDKSRTHPKVGGIKVGL